MQKSVFDMFSSRWSNQKLRCPHFNIFCSEFYLRTGHCPTCPILSGCSWLTDSSVERFELLPNDSSAWTQATSALLRSMNSKLMATDCSLPLPSTCPCPDIESTLRCLSLDHSDPCIPARSRSWYESWSTGCCLKSFGIYWLQKSMIVCGLGSLLALCNGCTQWQHYDTCKQHEHHMANYCCSVLIVFANALPPKFPISCFSTKVRNLYLVTR